MSVQTIYKRLRAAGLSEAGAIGLMGNWSAESGLESCRVQGDFTADRGPSRSYADAVDNGRKDPTTFSYDAKGWGLAQWTYWSRKKALLEFCRGRSISIANEEAQVDFALQELREGYSGLYKFLLSAKPEELRTAVERVCQEYERPAVNNVGVRMGMAQKIKKELENAGEDGGPPRASAPTEGTAGGASPSPTGVTVTLPVLRKGDKGETVRSLQGILTANGFAVGLAGCDADFGSQTEKAVKKFQKFEQITEDGVVGEMTWKKLMGI